MGGITFNVFWLRVDRSLGAATTLFVNVASS